MRGRLLLVVGGLQRALVERTRPLTHHEVAAGLRSSVVHLTEQRALDLRGVLGGGHVLVVVGKHKVAVRVLHDKVFALACELGTLRRVKGVVEVEREVLGVLVHLAHGVHGLAVPAPELAVVVWLIQQLNTDNVVHASELLGEVQKHLLGTIHVRAVVEVGALLGVARVRLAVLRAVGAMDVDQHTDVHLVRPLDGTLHKLPAVLVHLLVRLKVRTLDPLATKRPVTNGDTHSVDTDQRHLLEIGHVDPCVPVFLKARLRALNTLVRSSITLENVELRLLVAVGAAEHGRRHVRLLHEPRAQVNTDLPAVTHQHSARCVVARKVHAGEVLGRVGGLRAAAVSHGLAALGAAALEVVTLWAALQHRRVAPLLRVVVILVSHAGAAATRLGNPSAS